MVMYRSAAFGLMMLALASFSLRGADDKEEKKPQPVNVRDLSQEVTALQTLYQLQLTKPQLVALKELARETADRAKPGGLGKASDKLRKALVDFRDALVKASDPDKIADLAEALDVVQQAEKATLDDELDITEEARTEAPKAFKLLTAKQFASYAGLLADGIGDPAEELSAAMVKARGLKDKEWKELRTQISDDVGRFLGGVDLDKADDFGNKAVQILIIARGLNDEEFKKEKPDLEKKVREFVGQVGATDIVRNVMEYRLAELMSNPRLLAAIDARLK
jgi:hypothetical protein